MAKSDSKEEVSIGPGLQAGAFGAWLYTAFRASSFKTITELAAAAGSNKATISRLMSGAPQTLTGKPSRPRPELVRKLAEVLKADEAQGMKWAGYGVSKDSNHKPTNLPELLEALEVLGIEIDWATIKGNFDGYTPEDFEELKEQIAANAGVKIRRITSR